MRFPISLLVLLFAFSNLTAQSAWQSLDKSKIENFRRGDRPVTPTAYQAFTLDMPALKKDLKKISANDISKAKESNDRIEVPFPNGKMVSFDVWNAPVMAPKLAARYPSIKSYKGISVDGKNVMRFLVSDFGFNGVISSSEGTIYVDPIFLDNPDVYQSYYIKDQEAPDPYWLSCGNEDDFTAEQYTTEEDITRSVAAIPLRTYRMAIACTGEYATIVGGTIQAVMEQYNLAAVRLSQIYEMNASITFELIEDIDKLIFLNPDTDPYVDADQGRELLGQNTAAINGQVSSSSYDIGHVFTRQCTDGIAGVAAFESACQPNKAVGVSCVGGANITSFASNTIAHEVGHQFGVSHSWNNCPSSQDQLAAGWAYEPGSGSTIMSYSGACGPSNVGFSRDYFSAGSLEQLIKYSTSSISSCGDKSTELNNEPIIDMPYESGFYIPISTPFILDASATDPDGDVLNYSWDQYDLGPSTTLGSPTGNSPLFVSDEPDENSFRYFPRLASVRGNLDLDIEILPNYERDMNFRFVVKDQNPMGSATVWEQVSFQVDAASGPFFVTKPNNNADPATVGQDLEVKWDVSNTDQAPVNCQLVNILLSIDDGRNFDYVLARNTPNDGNEIVRIPNAETLEARIKVESVGNIFYDMGNSRFIINAPTEPSYVYDLSNNYFDLCAPANVDIDIQSAAFVGYSEMVNFSLLDVPAGVTANFTSESIQPDGSTSLSFDISNESVTGEYIVTLQSISGSDTISQPIYLNLTATDFEDLALSYPENGASGIEQFPIFEWAEAKNSEYYVFELATSPAFGASVIEFDNNVIGTSYAPSTNLEKSTLYYWRVSAGNKCFTGTPTRLNTFGTIALSCKSLVSEDGTKNISASGSGDYTIFKEVFIPEVGQVSDIEVKKVSGNHQRFSNLVFSLESPAGTRANLVSNKCGSTNGNFDCGFADSSPTEISCPFDEVYKPEEPLSVFIGEDIQGSWLLNINDQTVGSGGQFEEFELQICSNATLDAPVLVNNNALGVHPGSWATLDPTLLLVEDANNNAEELVYTVVDLPTNGYLEIFGNVVEIGTQYTQQDIEQNNLRYVSMDETATTDQFTFTCIDGEGGWIDITAFDIEIDESFTSDIEEIYSLVNIKVVPNPASDLSIISINNTFGNDYKFSLVNISGQVFSQNKYSGDQQIEINVKDYPAGIYFISIESAGNVSYEKMVVVK